MGLLYSSPQHLTLGRKVKKGKQHIRVPLGGSSLISRMNVGLLGIFKFFNYFRTGLGGSILDSLEKASTNTFLGPGM